MSQEDPKTSAADRLAEWQALDERVRAAISSYGMATPQQVAGLSGVEMLRAIIDGRLPAAPITKTLDFTLVLAEVGRVAFQGRPSAAHYNPMGTVHGGWFATLLDSALGCVVMTMLPAGKAYTTAELKINMVRPLTDKTPLVRAEATIVHSGGRMATAEGRLTGTDGKLYAHGSTTCFIFDHP